MNNFYIYAHYKLDGTVFYVGKGHGNRAYRKYGRSQLWKNIVAKHGLEVRIWADNLSEEAAFAMECEWIKLYGRRDNGTGCLVNMTDGGEGMSNPSVDTRAKFSAARMGNTYNLGKTATDKHRANLSAAQKGNKYCLGNVLTAEHCANISAANKGRTLTTESRAKISAAKTGTVFSKEHRAAISAVQQARVIAKGRLPGTTFRKDMGKWVARIWLDGKLTNLGSHATEQLAHEAYLAAKAEIKGNAV